MTTEAPRSRAPLPDRRQRRTGHYAAPAPHHLYRTRSALLPGQRRRCAHQGLLPLAGQTQPDLPTLTENGPRWAADAVRPIVRTYSIRAVRPEQAEVDIEFAIHDHQGPAVDFCAPGESRR